MTLVRVALMLLVGATLGEIASAQALTIQFPQTLQRSVLPSITSAGGMSPEVIAVGDLNADQVPDLVYAGWGGTRVYLQGATAIGSTTFEGHGEFTDVTASQPIIPGVGLWGLQSFGVAMGDLDGDGDLDVVLGTSNAGLQGIALLNNGQGLLTPVVPPFNSSTGWYNIDDLRLGDVDGDGDLDCVIATTPWGVIPNCRLLLFLNNGSGLFSEATVTNLPVITSATPEVVLYDEDGDGDLDMFVGSWNGPCRLLNNNGSGVFADVTASTIGTITELVSSVDAGDIDGDGRLDVLVGSLSAGGCFMLTRPGGGAYVRTNLGFSNGTSSNFMKARLADVDQDCDLDLVVSHDSVNSTERTELALNNGAGVFTSVTTTRVFADTGILHSTMTVADIDADGDNDLLFGLWANTTDPLAIYYNNFRDFDAPRTASVSLSSYNYDASLQPGFVPASGAADWIFLAMDFGTTSPLTPIPALPRNPCASTPDNLFGLTSASVTVQSLVTGAPGATFNIPIGGGAVGDVIFAQPLFLDLLSTDTVLGPVTKTILVP